MRYLGAKRGKLLKEILSIIDENIKTDQYYVEPFVGGCNVMSYVNHPYKIASDIDDDIIEMWKVFQKGVLLPPDNITKEMYDDMKENPTHYPQYKIGYVKYACSFGSGLWNGYAAYNPNKNNGKGEDHIQEAYNGTIKQLKSFKHFEKTVFLNCHYTKLVYPPNSFIYLDPPYQGTKKYRNNFDSYEFWRWCRMMKKMGHTLLISEYNAPDDFECIYNCDKKDGMPNM